MRSAIHCLIITQKIRHKEIRTKEKRCAANQCSTPFFAVPGKRLPCLHVQAFAGQRTANGFAVELAAIRPARLPCLHEQVFAPLRSCWTRATARSTIAGKAAKGFAVSCPQYRSITETLRRKQDYDHKYI